MTGSALSVISKMVVCIDCAGAERQHPRYQELWRALVLDARARCVSIGVAA